ncbi:protein FAR1-RELATED SEQUENCE 6-like [Arachis duranensis]|uniref:Protein FAR1-RELATED SEQUENCE 6-like n=1 Tax=Arachis duranensis TaxID=130453 RepID=A0A6P5MTW6_ARADU|nr:protein FAR1-RELATED SEQUENCE 6-like [Arachis duranensis]
MEKLRHSHQRSHGCLHAGSFQRSCPPIYDHGAALSSAHNTAGVHSFRMAESQEERAASEGPHLCTSPSRNSLMEVDIVEPLVCVASEVSENLSNEQENLAANVAEHGHKSNKLSDVMDVGSEEMEPGDELLDHGNLQEDEIPRVGMRFPQLQMAHDFYVSYAKKAGFATKIRTTTFDKITKAPINQAIHCNRDGIRESRVKAPTRKNTISAAGCKARIYLKFDKDMQDWVLFKVNLTHSHSFSVRKAVHHEYRQLTIHAKCVIKDNDEAVIRPNKTFLALANEGGGPSNLGYLEKDLGNYITARLRSSNVNADVREMMSYFRRMKDINPNFFYAVKLDDECKFKSAVWVDARCRASYEYYGDVVSVDSTYNRNRHGLPFVSFVGVNHHGRSTLLGCALLGNEEIGSYEWVFLQWVKCMGTAPKCIITDQCRSLYRAIKNTLPDTRHRWCIWHIMNKLPSKLGGYRRYGALYGDLNDIVWNSRTEESFEDDWADFIDEYNLHNNTWLSGLICMMTDACGSQYTSRVNFGQECGVRKGVRACTHSTVDTYTRELEDDAADSRGVIPCATTSPIEKQFQQEYTTSIFRDVQIEFVRKANCRVSAVDEQGPVVCVKVEEEKLLNDTILCVPYDVHFDRSTHELRCECNLFESSGVLCCHCLEVFHSYKVYKVPSCYILPRWSKKIKCKHTYVKSSHDVSRSDESHVAFRKLCAHFYNVAQEFLGDDEETALLHVALEETRAKLATHRAKKRSERMAETQTNIGSQSSNDVGVDDIQGPSKVTTKGRPKSKRLGSALEKSIKNSRRRKQKNSHPVVRPHTFQDINHCDVSSLDVPKQDGGFILDVHFSKLLDVQISYIGGWKKNVMESSLSNVKNNKALSMSTVSKLSITK